MNPNEAILVWADEYGRMAEVYDRIVTPRFEPIARTVVDLLGPRPGEMVLDIGTGTGLLARLLAPLVAPQAVVAIDLADQAISVASHRAGNAGIRNIRFEMMDARNIVYRGRLFDGIASNLGIPSLGYDRTFYEAHRLLKPGGRFVFSGWDQDPSPAEAAFRELLETHATPVPSKELASIREVTRYMRSDPESRALRDPAHVREKLTSMGFRQVDVVTKDFATRFEDVRDLVAFYAAWGWTERELREMTPDRRQAVDRDLAARLGAGGFEDPWRLHFFVARS